MSSIIRPGIAAPAFVAALVLVLFVGSARTGQAQGASQSRATEIAYQAVDVFPIRFGGFLRFVAGNALLVPATIFATLSLPFDRNLDAYRTNYEMLVQEPFDYTFRRPLGEDF